MDICRGSKRYPHDEIVYEGDCPCCTLLDEKFELENEISKLQTEIDRLNAEV
jgi:hypothetical protein